MQLYLLPLVEIKRKIIEYLVLRKPNMKESSHSSVWGNFLSHFLLVSILSYITGTPPDICTVEIKRKIIEYLVLRKPNMKESEYTV